MDRRISPIAHAVPTRPRFGRAPGFGRGADLVGRIVGDAAPGPAVLAQPAAERRRNAMTRIQTVQHFHWGFRLVAALVIVCLATGCASTPPSGVAPALPSPPPTPPGAFPTVLPAVAAP